MSLVNKNSFYYPWLKLNVLGFTGGILGSYIAVFFLDFFNPLDLFVPPFKSTVWACTCGFLGLFAVNSMLITERTKCEIGVSVIIFFCLFTLHSLLFKFIILGIGKLFIISGSGLGLALLYGRHRTKEMVSRVRRGTFITSLVFITSFIFIGSRYFIASNIIFKEPIDLQIWFTWTIMCTWIGFLIGFEGYIS